MKQLQILLGSVTVQITSADMGILLNAFTANGIVLQKVTYCDDLTVRLTVARQNKSRLLSIAEKQGAVVKILRISGLFLIARRLGRRPVLTLFLLTVFLLACYIPGRIFFLTVEGNEAISDRYILEIAADCGIDFGAKRRLVRSEMMKNRLLEKIPQLQWAGINTSGCTAVISVREKTTQDKQSKPNYAVSSIVATRDGIIQNCTVLQGNSLCKVGQAVKAGQVLVSGYLDCGIVTKTTLSDAEINALTFREIEVIAPGATVIKGKIQEMKTHYSLRIGKNLIKFYKDSGNSNTSCGKIYVEEYVYLPGGFRLPVAVVKETEIYYASSEGEQTSSDTGDWLQHFSETHLKGNMISGKILSAETEITPQADACCLYGKYACVEMIGQIKYEQTIPKDDVKWQNGS